MSQSLVLTVAGLYTSQSDYQGLPPGALDVADNVESRYKNVLEARRGFESLLGTITIKRLTNFYVNGVDTTIGITSNNDLVYYNGTVTWPSLPGTVVANILPPDPIDAKSRFLTAGQNMYVTALDGVRSLASASGSNVLRAGVPKGLNLLASTNGDSSGFLDNNNVLTTVGTVSASGLTVTNLGSTVGIVVGQYVASSGVITGTTISSITSQATLLIETGNTTAGSAVISNLASISGLSAGVIVSASSIPDGARIVAATGSSPPYNVSIDSAAFQGATGTVVTFSSPVVLTMSAAATGNCQQGTMSFYAGAQVAYRMVFGRIESDINGGTITRLGAPSSMTICTSTSGTATNTVVTGTLPKNSTNELTFVQLYRSSQTASAAISPLDQYNLVYERTLTASDFTARTITITDSVTDSLVGIPLYTGSDQEGIGQANNPPPMAWDICKFRDFTLYGNITQPSTLKFTVLSVGAPSGIQVGDTLAVSGSFIGTPFLETYTAATGEVAASRQFKIVTTGTPSQNIADTTDSLIRVVNYDNSLPVHAILLSSATDLPGQILLEADNPSYDTFTANASTHKTAYDPTLSTIVSAINTQSTYVAASKAGELEAVPALNTLPVGDSSASIIRVIPLRDYVIVLKTDGVYKILGTSPKSLSVTPFDQTTNILGADTAVNLDSAVWMLSNQGVVKISDGGVEAKSIPIDDQLNTLIGTYRDNLVNSAFAIGYESDRKYILCVPTTDDNAYAEIEYNFNYITSAWTTWSRNFYTGFVNQGEGKIYVARADALSLGVSRERKTASYRDYVDEAEANTIISVSGTSITMDNVDNIAVGDILYQSATLFTPVLAINTSTLVITVQYSLSFVAGAVSILKAYECLMTWKQVFGDNPAFVRQFSEGLALFKNTRFNTATAKFATDFAQNTTSVTLTGSGNSLWGLFPWGSIPWGGQRFPSNIRFYIPQDKQLGAFIFPTMSIKQGYSDFKFQGMSISYENISMEVGK